MSEEGRGFCWRQCCLHQHPWVSASVPGRGRPQPSGTCMGVGAAQQSAKSFGGKRAAMQDTRLYLLA